MGPYKGPFPNPYNLNPQLWEDLQPAHAASVDSSTRLAVSAEEHEKLHKSFRLFSQLNSWADTATVAVRESAPATSLAASRIRRWRRAGPPLAWPLQGPPPPAALESTALSSDPRTGSRLANPKL